MKTSTAMMALVVGLSAPAAADAQLFRGRSPGPRTAPDPSSATPAAAAKPATKDEGVKPSGFVVPPPVNADNDSPPAIPLPKDPIEPYLLTSENGPFMVLAHTFKGAHAEKYAQALAIELRSKFGLPAYVLRPKDFPLRSLIRGVPPTANPGINRPIPGLPEAIRNSDEAAVLVGDEKTEDDSWKLLKQVKHIHPACLDAIPDPYPWRKGRGLRNALATTNPYVPAERIFQDKPDLLVRRINQGPHSIYTCPGKYSLQIAEFRGRSAIVNGKDDANKFNPFELKRSPLATAADDAEKLAESLAKDSAVRQTGYVPYVFHDRTSSRVYIGAFNSPSDPAAARLRDDMVKLTGDLSHRKVSDIVIVPATGLTDVTPFKAK